MRLLTLLITLLLSSATFAANPQVQIDTSLGKIVVELNPAAAPVTVDNFLRYVNEGYYADVVFHRVINGFMIQGGGFDTSLVRKQTHEAIKIEADNGLSNDVGTIAMARTRDPHSATSQFFINVKDNDFLNHREKSMRGWGYTVFGKVISGMDVVNKINSVPTGAKGPFHSDVPEPLVVIEGAKVIGAAPESDAAPAAK